ncbi:hypothetical protein EDD90_10783 [Streptomyces sp. Ag109_O5-1]|nr:hypothetical protein EDD90_10783 [Streptomyces sp. Ag109_O5-1]
MRSLPATRPVDLFAAVKAAAVGADDGVRLDRLRVDHTRTRLRVPAQPHPDPGAQPVMELLDQGVVAPAAEEGIHPVPRWEVDRHRPPLDAVVNEIADRIEHRAVAIPLRPAAPPAHPARRRQQRPDLSPLLVRHVRRVPALPFRPVSRVAVHVREAITRWSGRVGLPGHRHGRLRHRGLLLLYGFDTHELFRRPLPHALARAGSPDREPAFDRHHSRSKRQQLLSLAFILAGHSTC